MKRFWTRGPGTDIRKKDPACLAWEPGMRSSRCWTWQIGVMCAANFDLFQVTGQKDGESFCAGLILKNARYMRAAPIY
jgi:hypothetical protein